jgi:lysophospholipase L1-like esterase
MRMQEGLGLTILRIFAYASSASRKSWSFSDVAGAGMGPGRQPLRPLNRFLREVCVRESGSAENGRTFCQPGLCRSPSKILPVYDSGDHGHPNDAGYQAMAEAIDLKLFK